MTAPHWARPDHHPLPKGTRFDGAARCAETDPEKFYPEHGENAREARKVCAGCEVQTACLTWALDNNETWGIWGGTSTRDRQKLRLRRASA